MFSKLKPAATRPAPTRFLLIALLACSPMMTSCAVFGRASVATAPTAPPPELEMPKEVRDPCALRRLPANPTEADLETAYAVRGAQIVTCDAMRELAVLTFDRQALALERQQEARERRRSRACRWIGLGC